jgi:hypothetical protein
VDAVHRQLRLESRTVSSQIRQNAGQEAPVGRGNGGEEEEEEVE